jgi:uncharacterized protein (DUF1800 family)
MGHSSIRLRKFFLLPILMLLAGFALAQAPDEVQGVGFDDPAVLDWNAVAGADHYQVYRGGIQELSTGNPGRCHGFQIESASFATPAEPGSGQGFFYLVTAESITNGEGSPGSPTGGGERGLLGTCRKVMRNHVLNRGGYGWDEWSSDRIDTLGGLNAYIAEQLDPLSIDESTNTNLNSRLALIDPPSNIVELIAQRVIKATYARRQLEQQVAAFWANHFNTFYVKLSDLYRTAYPDCDTGLPQCDPNFPEVADREATLAQYREMEAFRDIAFNGNFREMLEATALSPAMILFLDTFSSVAGSPNENYPRELLELYTLGVDGGYTQQHVEELARVFTGITICKKKNTVADNPLAPCLETYWDDAIVGRWSAVFVAENHDCTQKVLFQGTPQEAVIPDTCATPAEGLNDIYLALDAIAAHPSAARFISTKILERLVTEEPDTILVDALVAEWNDASNPNGIGDLRAVLEAALTSDTFLDPDRIGSKIKTPLEQFVSALRALRGSTDGVDTILDFLIRAQHIPHYNPVPTGFPEAGGFWIDTTGTLERQSFGLFVAYFNYLEFGTDFISLLNDKGVSTAPGNSETIIDFLIDVLYGGALTPAERQAAIDFLDTDESGGPIVYDEIRIRLAAGYLLGYPQFQEQ